MADGDVKWKLTLGSMSQGYNTQVAFFNCPSRFCNARVICENILSGG